MPTLDTKRGETDGSAGDVDDGVNCAYFVEVHLLDRDAVNGGFRSAEQFERAEGRERGQARRWAQI